MHKRILVSIPLLVLAAIVALVAWHFFGAADKGGKPAQPTAIAVSSVTAQRMNVPVRLQANGYVSSLNSVEVRPQVSNLIARVHIREGQFVKAGELLFSLDDRADRVNLRKAQAQLAKDQATLADAERQLARSRELLAKGFVSQSAVDTVQTQAEAARATLQGDEAAVAAARVALEYDSIRAPSSGRAGAITVFAGSLVQPGMATPMVTISQLDPIAVSFTLPEQELAALLEAKRNGEVKVTATVASADAPLEGRVSFIDNSVDSQNGTIRVKAVFPNPSQLLWPGQYVTVSTVVREIRDGIVVPQAAIITGPNGSTIYVIGADNTAQQRKVGVDHAFGTQAVVSGLRAGERVVVDGKQNLRPGSRVDDTASKGGA